jgi:sterol desaturase/sphingolipid hydroxylase (fatty acid hydroxylase superfamily)
MLSHILENPPAWLPFLLFWPILIAVAVAELWRPLYVGRSEPRSRIPVNVAFGLINAAIAALLPVSTVLAAGWAQRNDVGLLHLLDLPPAAAVAATVAARSLATYFIHRASHALPWLWRIHRVHHSDTALDLSTGLRNHPLELAIVAPALAAVTIAGGLDPLTLFAYEAIALPFNLWTHANLGLHPQLDRRLRLLLVTPAMHHVHHSARRAETDSNYGDLLSLWDRLFGTYAALDRQALQAVRFGLGEAHDQKAANLAAQMLSPLRGGNRSEAGQESGDVGAERVHRIAALHDDQARQPERGDPAGQGGVIAGAEREEADRIA